MNITPLLKEFFFLRKLIFLFLVAFSFTACKECQDCTCTAEGISTTQELCKEDMTTAEYNAAIAVIENNDELDCKCN
tara:strand:- start:29496 stop:29726 length:231 start_codon:yes stop_codon:yes gene_type:complete